MDIYCIYIHKDCQRFIPISENWNRMLFSIPPDHCEGSEKNLGVSTGGQMKSNEFRLDHLGHSSAVHINQTLVDLLKM